MAANFGVPVQEELFPQPPSRGVIGSIELWAASSGLMPLMGVDEAGRGPLAGPVVASAVILPTQHPPGFDRLDDSKKLTPKVRNALYDEICLHADAVGIGTANVDEIDTLNILGATRLAMHRAIEQCQRRFGRPVCSLMVDGNLPLPGYAGLQWALIKGDGRSFSIAAASVIAKVTRDRLMCALDARYPGYGFAKHKGYGTQAHRIALTRMGPCAIHRKTFTWKPFVGNAHGSG